MVVEVYALQALLVTAFLGVALSVLDPARDATRNWLLLGLAIGLAVTNHLTGVLLIPVLVLILTLAWRDRTLHYRMERNRIYGTFLGSDAQRLGIRLPGGGNGVVFHAVFDGAPRCSALGRMVRALVVLAGGPVLTWSVSAMDMGV